MPANAPDNSQASLARLYRTYVAYCTTPTEDAVFTWLEALHSVHDRAGEPLRTELFAMPEFLAMKAIRNHFHHGGEVGHRLVPIPGEQFDLVSDLLLLCLVARGQVEAAIAAIPNARRAAEQPQIEAVLKWYGPVVNINPAVFNLMAKITLAIEGQLVQPLGEPAYAQMLEQLRFERANGHSHFVEGDIGCHAADVDALYQEICRTAGVR